MSALRRPRGIFAALPALRRRALGVFGAATAVALAALTATPASADNARFDLTGPRVEVRVTRAGVTLPIASVPNLKPGDRLWLHPDLPESQSVRYLMVLAFLRGTTNPPPDQWFTRVATWDKKVRAEGVTVTVPDEAQQAVLFLAPVTGGDFTTLRSAVQGRPGIFVRAAQDLTAAGFEEARIEKYVASMRQLPPEETADPKQLQTHSNLIAATLALKPNDDCVKLPPDQQYTCLMQSGSQTLLDDGHGQSIVDALTGGDSAGLIGTASGTQLAGGGLYSAYVGTVVDLVHIMGSLHTAQYQYIPAIAFPQQEALNLRLNTPPSFHNPKSVLVIGLPSVQSSIPPPLRAADPKQAACLAKPGVVLAVEGAPLVFSTGFAHDLVLHLNYPPGSKSPAAEAQDIPLTADAFRGGLVLAPEPKRRALHDSAPFAATQAAVAYSAQPTHAAPALSADKSSAGLTGTVKGYWGFEPFTGPTMPLQDVPGKEWRLAADNTADHWLIAGKGREVELASTGDACVESVALDPSGGKPEAATFKRGPKPGMLNVTMDVPSRDAGRLELAIREYGAAKPATVALTAYSEPAKLDAVFYHAGDATAELTGASLDRVTRVAFAGLSFQPAGSTPAQPNGKSELRLTLAPHAAAPSLTAGSNETAKVSLDDDRILSLPFTVLAARPSLTMISRADLPHPSPAAAQFALQLGTPADLPVSDALNFSLRSAEPFPRGGFIEIASPDGSLHTRLSLADSSLVLEDPHTLLATLQPLKELGSSAFGPIQLRAVAPDGTTGDWLPLVTLVRLPSFTGLSCPAAAAAPILSPETPSVQSVPSTVPTADATGATGSGSTASAVASAASASLSVPASPDAQRPSLPASAIKPASSSSQTSAPPAFASPDAQPSAPPAPMQQDCTLTGTGLFFVDSVALSASFADPTHVPEGYVASSIEVPPPTGAVYYLRLRDDPATTDTLTLPVVTPGAVAGP